MKIITDKNGIVPKEGDIVTGLYSFGDDTGVVIRDESGALAVRDADVDILEIESVLKVATIQRKH